MKMNTWLFALLTPFIVVAQHPNLVVPLEHSDAISTIAASPDDNYVLSGTINGEVKLWNKSGRLVRDFPGHKKPIIEVAFSPKGNYVISKSDDVTILYTIDGDSLWSTPTTYNYARYSFIVAGNSPATDVFEQYDRPIFSPDEKWVLTSASDSTALAFNILNQQQKLIPSTQKQNLHFSPNGKTLLSQEGDQILLFNEELQLIQEFTTPESRGKALFVNDQEIAIGYLYDDTFHSSGFIAFYDLDGQLTRQLGKPLHKWRRKIDNIIQYQLTIDSLGNTISMDTIFTNDKPTSWSAVSGSERVLYGNVYWNEMQVSPDGTKLILNSERFTECWDVVNGVQYLASKVDLGYFLAFSIDSKNLLFKKDTQATVYNWDLESLASIPNLYASAGLKGPRSGTWPGPVTFLQNPNHLLVGQGHHISVQDFKSITTLDFGLSVFHPIRRIDRTADQEELSIKLSTDSTLVFNLKYNLVRPQEPGVSNRHSSIPEDAIPLGSKYLIHSFESPFVYSPTPVILREQGFVEAWDRNQQPLFYFQPNYSVADHQLVDNDQFLVIAGSYGRATLWDFHKLLKLGSEIDRLIPENTKTDADRAPYTPPGQRYIPMRYAKEALVDTLHEVPRCKFRDSYGDRFLFQEIIIPDWTQKSQTAFTSTFQQGDIKGNFLTFSGHAQPVVNAWYINNGKQIISWSEGGIAKIWNPDTAEEIATLYFFNDQDWVITTKNGLFDASPGSMRLLYYTVGTELIELEQLKERFYEPGLLPKLIGYSEENIRPSEKFEEIALYPRIEEFKIDNDSLHLHLKARNGGIGKVVIFINGKEVEAEANPLPRSALPKRDSSIHYDLYQHRNYLFRHPDSINTVSIRVYNEAGWLKSPAISKPFTAQALQSKGWNGVEQGESWVGKYRPKLYVVSIGTSNYRGSKLDLQYADQDASMMADALHLAGSALFANGDSLEVHCLSTANTTENKPKHPQVHWSTSSKSNIEQVFQQIRHSAKAEDIVVVYLSGHGVTYGGADETQFYYLTQDISNEGELGDPGTLKKFTISSEELTGWINAIPALKQVLILDACNSGQIINNITGSTKRLNSSQIRALDRMKDRTGLFVLAGSASDKVSYEAGQYGQGLLTYALLKNMRGVDAKSDDVDVMEWFQYARNEVPRLAKSINGIQTPMLGFPSHGASFDIGIRSEEVKANIPIGNEKPVVIRSNFFNEVTFKDDLKLADQLETLFIKETEKGADANLIYVDVSDYPNAYSLGGLYKTKEGKINSIKVKLFKGEEELMELDILASETTEELVSEIFEALLDEVYFNE